MKMHQRIILLLIVFMGQALLSEALLAQSKGMKDIQRRSKRNERLLGTSESKKVRKAKEKAEGQKEEQKKKEEEATKEGRKQHMDMQTPKTRERMEETRKKSDEYKNRNREPFFKRIFKRKKKHYES